MATTQIQADTLLIPPDVLEATKRRYAAASDSSPFESLETAEPRFLLTANSRKQLEARLRHLGLSKKTAKQFSNQYAGSRMLVESDSLPMILEAVDPKHALALERLLGNNDLMSIRFLDFGAIVGRTVARIVIRRGNAIVGFGTGAMVSPRLLLTNNHVLTSAESAAGSLMELNYQEGVDGTFLNPVTFALDPDSFFVTDRTLDYSIIAVGSPVNRDSEPLVDFGWNRLSEGACQVIIGEYVNIIQHPNGERKQLALRENQVVAMPEDRFLQYKTDTAPGSSGAPVLNDQWEVVALHHSGVPRRDSQGRLLARDGSVWSPSMGEHRIDWIANEGILISEILKDVRSRNLSGTARKLRSQLLDGDGPNELDWPRPASHLDPHSEQQPFCRLSADRAVLTIPLEVSVRVRQPEHNGIVQFTISTAIGGGTTDTDPGVPEEEAISIDPDYTNREGYDCEFLGDCDIEVLLPELSNELKEHAAINEQAQEGEDPFVLPYHHFSVVMNGTRRLAYYTAVNIDGRLTRRVRRDRDRWYFDPRIDRDTQAGNEIYARNPLDRGHLVRRLDPAWGDPVALARIANDDTFHFTNCSPQHKDFNQNQTTWAGLENYILDNADVRDFKVSVFTGPVFADSDQQYRGIQLPRQFWKVVVMVKDNGQLSATAYLLSQERLIRNLGLEGFHYGEYSNFQVPVRKIEELTGLSFGTLSSFDPITRLERFGADGIPAQEVATFEDLIL